MLTRKQRVDHDGADHVRLYLNEIGRFALISAEDEIRLAKQIENGGIAREKLSTGGYGPGEELQLRRTARHADDARRTFVQANLRLVVSIAKKYQASGLPLLDLIQEGNLGMMHAVEKFDWRKGFKFSTYASWWIRQAITRGISNTSRTIRLPVHTGDMLARLQSARSSLELEHRRPATLSELAVEVNISENRVTEMLRFGSAPRSFDEPLGGDSDAVLGDLIEDAAAPSPPDAAMLALLPRAVETLLEVLDTREHEIISLRFGLDRGEPRTLEEVGKYYNLTRERIRQIEAKALAKLRHPSNDATISSLLDA